MAEIRCPSGRDDFEIAIICALITEFDAVDALLETDWEDGASELYGRLRGDPNTYKMGRIGKHNVVLACLPEMGKTSAATTATWLSASFPNIKLGLVVGICGAVPFAQEQEIVLGDVIISTGIVQFDFGRQYPDEIRRKDTLESNLPRPPTEIRSFLKVLESRKNRKSMGSKTAEFIGQICEQEGFEESRYPGSAEDRLYETNYRHKHQDATACTVCANCKDDADPVCDNALELTCKQLGCSTTRTVKRAGHDTIAGINHAASKPHIHFGRVASGDLVMKSGSHRDKIASKEGVIAFEMEGAGVWEAFPTVVIKAVCDYADSHKSKRWQKYATVVAAACCKAVLGEWRSSDESLGVRRMAQNMAQSINQRHPGDIYLTTYGTDNRGVQAAHIDTFHFSTP